ncbi:hypothetical protein [Antrihabitans sp. YC2-6]|uniref:hypothetical protein n=1 Tax=Antrihabitans sp. YC2-6 TaxID=2799498 RepID=UPI0018F64894|nr:hypothetical protein [Antrihabitans sp. YC2-6]MBJ8344673.1 hypothetical protein [Antrihabitans sp. YC2-6]
MKLLPDALRRVLTRSNVLAFVLIAVAVTFTALAGAQLRDHHDAEEALANDAAILSAANSGVTAMISVRDNSAADDVAKVLDQSTGAFKADFEQRSESFISVVQEAKVVTQGEVVASGIESRDGDSATVLVSATSTVSNAAGADNETRSWRLRVTMTDDDGAYKMSNVEFVA